MKTASKSSILKVPGIAPDLEVIVTVAGRFGADLPDKSTPTKLVKMMRDILAPLLNDISEDDWIMCERCGEVAPDHPCIDCCPYCGDEGLDAAPEQGPPKVAQIEEARRKRLPAPEPELDTSVVIAKAQDGLAEMKRQLEQVKARIRDKMTNMAASGWDMGEAFREVHEHELWKADGHKNFAQFARAMGVGSAMAYNLINIVDKFDRETYLKIGVSKLALISSVSPERRPELLEKAESGASTSEIAKDIARERAVRKGKVIDTQAESPRADSLPPDDGRITLLAKVDPKTKQQYRWLDQDGKQAKVWSKGCRIEVRISDDVVMFVENRADKDGNSTGISISFDRATGE